MKAMRSTSSATLACSKRNASSLLEYDRANKINTNKINKNNINKNKINKHKINRNTINNNKTNINNINNNKTNENEINKPLTDMSRSRSPGECMSIYVYRYIHTHLSLLDLCVSSLRRGHANLLCIVPILTDDPRRESYYYYHY